MVTRLPAGFHAAGLLFLKEVDEFGYCGFLYTKFLLTGMGYRGINAGKPGRMGQRNGSLAPAGTRRGESYFQRC